MIAQPQRTLDLFAQAAQAAAESPDGCGDVASRALTAHVDVDQTTDASADGASTSPTRSTEPATPFRPVGDGRPLATLYVHVAADAIARDADGVARFEGLGPITMAQARSWLGHCQVTIKPVIDLNDQVPVDAYEIPDRLREAVHLRSPVDVFPFATNSSRRRDIDHTDPFRSPDDGGPPCQTRLDNLGPMVRFHHRIKTHSRWQVKQPFNGVFVWRSPHGRVYVVDSTGTRPAHAA